MVMTFQGIGVKFSDIMNTIHNDTLESLQKKALLLNKAVCVLDGKVAYVCVDLNDRKIIKNKYEDIHPIADILRDCEDIELSFTMYEEAENKWRCSFRSDGEWIDVNELLTPFGGGGHAAAAGLKKTTDDVEKLREAIFERIKDLRE